MLAFRWWIALGLAVAWNGTSLAQGPSNPGDPEVSREPARVVYFVDSSAGGSAADATPVLDEQVNSIPGSIADDAKRTTVTQDVLIQDGAPNASMKLVSELLGTVDTQPQWPLFFRGIPNEQGLGASFEPADESLRAQLDIPKGQGLVVTSIAPGGPAARIGVAANDILLALGDKPLGSSEDLSKAVKATGEEPVALRLLRRGKAVTIRVKPEHHVTLGPVATTRTRYLIGVQVTPLEGPLRSHLGLPDAQGLVVSSVEQATPAEKAGIKKNDILLSIGEKPLSGTENLVAQVQESHGKPITLKLLRSGKPQTVELTPDERKETIDITVTSPDRMVFTAVRPTQSNVRWLGSRAAVTPPPNQAGPMNWAVQSRFPTDDRQMSELLREVKELRRAVDQLQRAMKEHEGGERKDR